MAARGAAAAPAYLPPLTSWCRRRAARAPKFLRSRRLQPEGRVETWKGLENWYLASTRRREEREEREEEREERAPRTRTGSGSGGSRLPGGRALPRLSAARRGEAASRGVCARGGTGCGPGPEPGGGARRCAPAPESPRPAAGSHRRLRSLQVSL